METLTKTRFPKDLFSSESLTTLESLIVGDTMRVAIRDEFLLLGPGVMDLFAKHRITIRGVRNQRIWDLSPSVKEIGESVDEKHTLGLFVWPDRTIYILAPMTGVNVHEAGHALDFCLALEAGIEPEAIYAALLKNKYDRTLKKPFRSETDPEIAKRIGSQTGAVSDYGMFSGICENWAEAVRAYCGANDGEGLFGQLSSAKLYAVNRPLYSLVLETFVKLNGRAFERARYASRTSNGIAHA